MIEHRLIRCRVGVFSTLTNSYALVAVGASENFYRYACAYPLQTRNPGRSGEGGENEQRRDRLRSRG